MYTLERPHIFTHIYSFSSFCDIIFIGFSFDDEKEKLCAGGGERERKKSAATHTRRVWPVLILTLWREQLSVRGQESAVRQKDFKLFLPVVIFLSFLQFSIRQKYSKKYFPVFSVLPDFDFPLCRDLGFSVVICFLEKRNAVHRRDKKVE